MSTTPKMARETPSDPARDEIERPGLLDVLIGLMVLGVFAGIDTLLLMPGLIGHPMTHGVISTFLSGALGAAAFAAAWALRRRPWRSYGVRATTATWLVIGVTAELRRRSGSIWPGTIVHLTNDSVAVGAYAPRIAA